MPNTQAVGDVRSPFTWVSGVASGHTVSLLVDGFVRAIGVAGPSGAGVRFNGYQQTPDFVLTTYGTHLLAPPPPTRRVTSQPVAGRGLRPGQ